MLKRLESISEWSGKAVSWLATGLVLVVVANVILRYFFDSSKIWLSELSWHFYAAMFLLGGAYALKHGKHVRVDVFYGKWSKKRQAIVNLAGIVLFLIPFCIMGAITAWPYALRSFNIGEGSGEPGGLPARYIIKFVIVLAFVLLLIQAIAEAIKNVKQMRN